MSITRKISMITLFLFSLPILLSLDSTTYDFNYFAKYRSPENIMFLSYTENWDEQKLQDLYLELIKNKHGDEINLLQEIRVRGEAKSTDSLTRGQYNSLTNTITLYHADTYLEPSDLSETLSHEYGHHFSYYYLKEQHFSFSTWATLRGLNDKRVRWDAFWNYSTASHKWYPQEVMADDYVLLYGPTKQVQLKDVYSNEAFYRKTVHDNQDISNVLENKTLHLYLEEATGFPVEHERLIEAPRFNDFHNGIVSFKITNKAEVAYRLNVTYDKEGQTHYEEFLFIAEDDTLDMISFSLEDIVHSTNRIELSIDVIDLNTSIGIQTKTIKVQINEDQEFVLSE
jgi:hypothetical protein